MTSETSETSETHDKAPEYILHRGQLVRDLTGEAFGPHAGRVAASVPAGGSMVEVEAQRTVGNPAGGAVRVPVGSVEVLPRFVLLQRTASTGAGLLGTGRAEPPFSGTSRTTMYCRDLFGRLAEVEDGGWYIDLAPLDDDPGLVSKVLHAPIPSLDPRPPLTRQVVENSLVAAALARSGGLMGHLARNLQKDPSSQAFAEVSPEAFADYWQRAGALVGQRVGGRVEWSDRTVSFI